jgi:hypothetical protein
MITMNGQMPENPPNPSRHPATCPAVQEHFSVNSFSPLIRGTTGI